MALILYHNPKCSKSRAALALLEERGLAPQIRLYLEEPLSTAELTNLLQQLGKQPQELIRSGEDLYKELNLANASAEQLIAAMATNPKLIERPVLSTGTQARIGRPPEQILEII